MALDRAGPVGQTDGVTWAAELGRTPLFEGMPADALESIAARAVHRRYRKGSVVFVQGERGSRCYTILGGSVKISAYAADGRETVLAVLSPGDTFGELSLFDEAPRSADATVIEPAELLSLDQEAVAGALMEHPVLGLALLRILSRRLRRANEAVQDVALFDVPARVARRLADLAATHGLPKETGTLVDLPLSQEALAGMVGATRESVNKALASLTRKGLVARQGRRYLIPDVRRLRERAR